MTGFTSETLADRAMGAGLMLPDHVSDQLVAAIDSDKHVVLTGPGDLLKLLLPLRRFADLGPAVYLDAAKYAQRRAKDDVTPSRVLFEAFYAYFLPQFDGLDEMHAAGLYRAVSEHLDASERAELKRCMAEILALEPAFA